MHEQTIQEHVQANLNAAIDQSHEYDQFATYKEGDAYLQNTIDSCLEDGYSWDEASGAGSLFHKLAIEKGVRFHGEEPTTQTTEEKPMEKVSFIGRKSGAIGIVYRIYSVVPKGSNTKEALAYLYDRYEWISELTFLDRE